MRLLRSTSPSSLLMASLDAARRQLAMHGEAMLHETLAAGRATRAKLATVPGIARRSAPSWSGGRASPAGTRCASCSTSAAPGAPATRSPTRCARPTTCSPSWRRGDRRARRRDRASCRGARARRRRRRRDRQAHRARRPRRRGARPAAARALGDEMAVAPRDAFLGAAEVVAVDDARRSHLVRVDRRLPAGHPGAAAGRADHRRRSSPTCARSSTGGARLHGASDPAFHRINVLREG